MKPLIALLSLLVAACGSMGSVVVSDIALPAGRYMKKPALCPPPPPNYMVNGIAKRHITAMTTACFSNYQKVRGLQRYARALAGESK